VERDCLSRLDVVLTDSGDDQDRDEGADMGGENFRVMGADKAGCGSALLLGQREPHTYNGKLPTADTMAAAVRTAKPTNYTSAVGFTSACAVPTTQACVGGWGGETDAAVDVAAGDGTHHRVGGLAAMTAPATVAAATAAEAAEVAEAAETAETAEAVKAVETAEVVEAAGRRAGAPRSGRINRRGGGACGWPLVHSLATRARSNERLLDLSDCQAQQRWEISSADVPHWCPTQ